MSDTESIKYRIVGAVVIIVSFTLAWWILLDHEVHRLKDIQADIPEPIKVERFDVKKPSNPIVVESPKSVKATVDVVEEKPEKNEKGILAKVIDTDKKSPAEKVKENPAEKKPKKLSSSLDQNGLPVSWVLQVASFQDKENATRLKDRLLKQKISAYVKAFNLPEGKSYKVLVGPKLNKDQLSKLARKIEKEQGLKSLIIRYKTGLEE